MQRIAHVFCLFLLFIIYGCAHVYKPPSLSKEVVSYISDRCHTWESFEMHLRIKLAKGMIKRRFLLSLWKERNSVRMDLMTSTGQSIAIGIFHHDSKSLLWLPTENLLYTANLPEVLLKQVLNLSITPICIVDVVTGCYSDPAFKEATIVTSTSSTGQLEISHVNYRKVSITYSPPFEIAEYKKLPENITIKIGNQTVKLNIVSVHCFDRISRDIFQLRIPKNVKRVDL